MAEGGQRGAKRCASRSRLFLDDVVEVEGVLYSEQFQSARNASRKGRTASGACGGKISRTLKSKQTHQLAVVRESGLVVGHGCELTVTDTSVKVQGLCRRALSENKCCINSPRGLMTPKRKRVGLVFTCLRRRRDDAVAEVQFLACMHPNLFRAGPPGWDISTIR